MNEITFVVATSGKLETTLFHKWWKKNVCDGVTLKVFENNVKGLSTVYNEALAEAKCKYMVFIHDDVYIDSDDWQSRIAKFLDQYDVIGIAGGSNIDINQKLLWHLMTDRDSQSGVVTTPLDFHGKPGEYFTNCFGTFPQDVHVLDGVFLAVNVESIKVNGIQFFEEFDFHHYDLSFTYECHLKGLKVSTFPLHLIHESPGLTSEVGYSASEEKFRTWLKKRI